MMNLEAYHALLEELEDTGEAILRVARERDPETEVAKIITENAEWFFGL
jgi:hypothetical protein